MSLKKIALATIVFLWFNCLVRAQNKIQSNASKQVNSPMLNGRNVYQKYCLSCHQADGQGVQRMNPPLSGTEYVLGDKSRLINIIIKGFNEDVEINGQYYSNTMPALDFLTDQQVADVLTFVRNSFGNKAAGIKAVDVTIIRKKAKKN